MPHSRQEITQESVELVFEGLRSILKQKFKEKGRKMLVSSHEVLGVITEEYYELISAVKNGGLGDINSEVFDIAIAAIVSAASLKQYKQMDW